MLVRSHTITLEAALRDLRDSCDPRTRVGAASALADADPSDRDPVVAALVAALADPHPDVRAQAALALGDLGAGSATARLADGLRDDTDLARQACAIALGKLGAGESFEALATALREGPPDLRFQAATSLVEIDPDRALTPLLDALARERDLEVLSAIALGLGAIGDPRAADALAAQLDHDAPRARFDVGYALAGLGDTRGIPALAEGAIRPELAYPAAEALEQTGASEAIAPLERALATRGLRRVDHVRAAAALLTLDPDHQAARRVLTSALRAWRPEARALAVESLARVGGTWSLGPLGAFARNPWGRHFRDEAAHAIAACVAAPHRRRHPTNKAP